MGSAPLTEKLVLSKTRAESLDAVRNLNLWGTDLGDVSLLQRMPNVAASREGSRPDTANNLTRMGARLRGPSVSPPPPPRRCCPSR